MSCGVAWSSPLGSTRSENCQLVASRERTCCSLNAEIRTQPRWLVSVASPAIPGSDMKASMAARHAAQVQSRTASANAPRSRARRADFPARSTAPVPADTPCRGRSPSRSVWSAPYSGAFAAPKGTGPTQKAAEYAALQARGEFGCGGLVAGPVIRTFARIALLASSAFALSQPTAAAVGPEPGFIGLWRLPSMEPP